MDLGVIASRSSERSEEAARQSNDYAGDCFVAMLLAMTEEDLYSRIKKLLHDCDSLVIF